SPFGVGFSDDNHLQLYYPGLYSVRGYTIMGWKHLRKQDVHPDVISQWEEYLRDANIDISTCDVDEFYDFDSGSIKVRAQSKCVLVITDIARSDRRPREIQKLRDFLNEHCRSRNK
ncbi:unnamed protein product, partial [marine sediment metagenome]